MRLQLLFLIIRCRSGGWNICNQGDLQLPLQTSTESLEFDSRGIRKQSLENNASHAVFAASGTVEADA